MNDVLNRVSMVVNDQKYTEEIPGSLRLLDFLRDRLELTGTKEGCGVGECGACTVILNGKTVCSCLILAAQCDGATIETIENLAKNGLLSRLQQAFVDHGGNQCGYCTPGMLMSAKSLLDHNPSPTEEEIRAALEGNICRCTGYIPIIDSIKSLTE